MKPLNLMRRAARAVGRRVRLPFSRHRAAFAAILTVGALSVLAVNAHAAARTGSGHTPTWLFSKLFRALGALMIALADWFTSIGR